MRVRRAPALLVTVLASLLVVTAIHAVDNICDYPEPRSDIYTAVGLIGLTVTNQGDIGNYLAVPTQPSPAASIP